MMDLCLRIEPFHAEYSAIQRFKEEPAQYNISATGRIVRGPVRTCPRPFGCFNRGMAIGLKAPHIGNWLSQVKWDTVQTLNAMLIKKLKWC